MSTCHPTKRDLLIVLLVSTILGLCLQFDFTFRSPSSPSARIYGSAGQSSLSYFLGIITGGRPQAHAHPAKEEGADGGVGNSWLENVETGARYDALQKIAGMGENRVKWAEGKDMETEILAHAPGWTIYDQIYLFNGTWYIVSSNPESVPPIRMMASSGAEAWDDEEAIAALEPTERDMQVVHPSDAKKLWGNAAARVSGTSLLVNDPNQFLSHYYHFAAELLVGLWRTYASLDPTISSAGTTHLPSPARLIFPHCDAAGWNDYAHMNSLISRAVFPSMSYEYSTDFHDRADTQRAFVFERVVFADRGASRRGENYFATHRVTSEAVTFEVSPFWWSPVRKNMLDFIGTGVEEAEGQEEEETVEAREEDVDPGTAYMDELDEEARSEAKLAKSEKPVITYVSRQDWGRRMLKNESHESLVENLERLRERYGWEVNIVSMDRLTRDEQIRLAARTTILLGVHGNGLTHLLWMNPQNRHSTVIEFFAPGGFAADYEFTARALGIRHYGVWDDQTFTYPDLPQMVYVDGFQGNEIPLDGKVVADLIVQRMLVDK